MPIGRFGRCPEVPLRHEDGPIGDFVTGIEVEGARLRTILRADDFHQVPHHARLGAGRRRGGGDGRLGDTGGRLDGRPGRRGGGHRSARRGNRGSRNRRHLQTQSTLRDESRGAVLRRSRRRSRSGRGWRCGRLGRVGRGCLVHRQRIVPRGRETLRVRYADVNRQLPSRVGSARNRRAGGVKRQSRCGRRRGAPRVRGLAASDAERHRIDLANDPRGERHRRNGQLASRWLPTLGGSNAAHDRGD